MSETRYITQTGVEVNPEFFTYSGETKMFKPLYVEHTYPLEDDLFQNRTKPDEMMIVVTLPDQTVLAIKQLHMGFHHIAQGIDSNGEPWMVMF